MFAGCSQVVVYSDSSVTSFTVVLYDEEDDEYSPETVSMEDADDTYQPDHPNFGSGQDGVIGDDFEEGDEFESGLEVVDVVGYGGADYLDPNVDVDTGYAGVQPMGSRVRCSTGPPWPRSALPARPPASSR